MLQKPYSRAEPPARSEDYRITNANIHPAGLQIRLSDVERRRHQPADAERVANQVLSSPVSILANIKVSPYLCTRFVKIERDDVIMLQQITGYNENYE